MAKGSTPLNTKDLFVASESSQVLGGIVTRQRQGMTDRVAFYRAGEGYSSASLGRSTWIGNRDTLTLSSLGFTYSKQFAKPMIHPFITC